MERGKFTTFIFVLINGERHHVEYVIDGITLAEAQYCINHEIFSHGKWETITNRIYL